MKIIVSVLITAALLCGCQKPAAPKPATNKIQCWEYKVVTVANYARYVRHIALSQMLTNEAAREQLLWAERVPGWFDFDAIYATNMTYEKYIVDFDRLGSDGWELVSAVTLLETIPDAQYGTENHPKEFDNTRTGEIILFFKRPK